MRTLCPFSWSNYGITADTTANEKLQQQHEQQQQHQQQHQVTSRITKTRRKNEHTFRCVLHVLFRGCGWLRDGWWMGWDIVFLWWCVECVCALCVRHERRARAPCVRAKVIACNINWAEIVCRVCESSCGGWVAVTLPQAYNGNNDIRTTHAATHLQCEEEPCHLAICSWDIHSFGGATVVPFFCWFDVNNWCRACATRKIEHLLWAL